MIITFSRDINTTKAVTALVTKHNQSVFHYFNLSPEIMFDQSDTTLILLDLSANGRTQNSIEPEIIIEKLSKCGLLKKLTSIQIIISDVSPSRPMTSYAWDLCKAIVENVPDSKICVTFSGNLDESPTFIEPPSPPNDNWVIYAISTAVISGLKDFSIYKTNANTKIFEGDITECLNDGEHTIAHDTIRATYSS